MRIKLTPKRLDPNRRLPKALQWIDQNGKLRDKVGHDYNLIGMVFGLKAEGDRLHIPHDIRKPGDYSKLEGISLNQLIKRRKKLQERDIEDIEAAERERRIQAFIDAGMGDDAEDGGMKDFVGYEYPHDGGTKVNLPGLAKATKRYGQFLES